MMRGSDKQSVNLLPNGRSDPRILSWLLDQFGCIVRGQSVIGNASVDLPIANNATCIIGPNGEGKSTLIKLFTGHLHGSGFRFQGTAAVDFGGGSACGLVPIEETTTPAQVASWGVEYVGQDPLLPEYTNPNDAILAGSSLSLFARCRHSSTRERLAHLAEEYGLQLDLGQRRSPFSRGELQKINILRGLARIRHTGLLVLDEATAGISDAETRQLFCRMKVDVGQGRYSVVFVSHRSLEIEFADRVFEVRHGRVFKTSQQRTVGTRVAPVPDHQSAPAGHPTPPALEASLRDGRTIRVGVGQSTEISFESAFAEEAFLRGLTGEDSTLLQALSLFGNDLALHDYIARRRLGLRIIVADRIRLGLFAELPVLDNIAIYQMAGSALRWVRFDLVRKRAEQFGFTDHHLKMPVLFLSGGFKQRALFAREMDDDAKVVVAFNPFQGIDSATRPFLEAQISKMLGRAVAIVIVSSDAHRRRDPGA